MLKSHFYDNLFVCFSSLMHNLFFSFFVIMKIKFSVDFSMPTKEISYSESYKDDLYEYRHVILPQDQRHVVPRTHLLTETEWRNLGRWLKQEISWKLHFMF